MATSGAVGVGRSLSRRLLDRNCHLFKVRRSLFSKVPEEGSASSAASDGNKSSSGGENLTEADIADLKAQLSEYREEASSLKEKNDSILDKYRRSIAENENMRKRLTKQIEDAKIFGIQSFCKDLLEVSDVLNKAVHSIEPEKLAESPYLKDMHQGLQITENQLLQVFKRHGLEKMNPLNQKFDPNFHEAVYQIPAPPGVEANVVLDVQKDGYVLQGRTIRPAVVGVSKK